MTAAIILSCALLAMPAGEPFRAGLVAGGPLASGGPCVTPAMRQSIRATVAVAPPARVPGTTPAAAPPLGLRGSGPRYPFFPAAGDFHADIFNGLTVDMDPASPAFSTFECLPFTYDGHAGIDAEIRSFGEQAIGVPVFAALDGTVIFAQDGFPDMNTAGGTQGNIIGLTHGQGVESWYYHLQMGSVAVSVGESVTAGAHIANIGSSGNSFGPHLHFETLVNGVPFEPFAGPCRPGESGWGPPQGTLRNHDSYLTDFATTHVEPASVQGFPHEMPRGGQIGTDDSHIRFWTRGVNLPPDSDWNVRFYRPDGTEALHYSWFFFNAETWLSYWFWWEYDIATELPDMLTMTGTWRIVVHFNETLMVDAPLEVRPTRTPEFNRPPAPIGVVLDPPAPRSGDVIFCRVLGDTLLDDLDYDIVRYRYVWRRDGQVIRELVSAGRSDAIPGPQAFPGATISCEVTPSDGRGDGAPATTSVVVALPPADLDQDGDVDLADATIGVRCLSGTPAGSCPPGLDVDLDNDGDVDLADFSQLLDAMTGPR